MRPTFIHVLTGVLLGTALAGLLNVPGRVVAHQESIPPVHSPHATKPMREPVVRVSPDLERSLTAKPAKPARPRPVTRVVLKPVPVRTGAPPPPAVSDPAPPGKPKPKPQPAVPPPAPAPAPAPAPPPAPAPAPAPVSPPRVVLETPPEDDDGDGKSKKSKKAKKAKKEKKKHGGDQEDNPGHDDDGGDRKDKRGHDDDD